MTWTEILLPAGIAAGALMQAAGVGLLIRRWTGYPSMLNDSRRVSRFFLLAGPLGCCINASIGTCLLVFTGKVASDGFVLNWVTWWVGDTLGGLIFTPLMLIAFGQPRAVWSPRWLTVALPLVLCFALAISIFIRVRAGDTLRKRTEFINLVDAATHSIESSLQDFTVIIAAMKGLFLATGEVGCAEAKTFTDILLEHKGGLQALEWALWVSQNGRKPFEQGHLPCDGDGSGITEKNAQGLIIPAGDRDNYLPVVFIDPLAPNRLALGFDLYSERLRSETILRARDTGSLAVTPPITLVQEPANKLSVLMVAPIYRQGGDTETVESRREHFTGIVLGVLRIDGLVNTALGKLGSQRYFLRLRIDDADTQANDGLLYNEDGFTPDGTLFQQRQIEIGGRVWRLSVSGNASDFGHGWFTWFVLAGGMLFCGVLGGFLLLLTGKTMSMESLIAERTDDLANTNKRLREEADERARTEIALRESESRFRTLANAAPVLIWLAGVDKLCHWFNQVWLDFTGRTMEQETGNGWTEGVHPDDYERCLDCYVSHFDRRDPFCMEYRLRRHDGEYRWLVDTGAPLVDGNGTFVGYIGSCIDVTERKANERAIQNLNRSYQDLLAAASEVAIISTDSQGMITLFNRGAERMLGYAAIEVVGSRTPAMFHLPGEIEARGLKLSEEFGFPVSGFGVLTAIPDIRGQEVREWTYVCKEGLCIWVSLVVTQIKSEEGEAIGYLGIAQNISERRAAEQALQRAKLAADKANQAKSEFLANMSHEIRTPMNGVLGMIELLNGTSLGSEQRELVETASYSAHALMEIINDILDFSKIEAGKLHLDGVDFNVSDLCENVCSLLAVTAQSKGLEFNCFIQPNMHAEVRGDATRLRQVLVNLIGNAIKFTLAGEVSVEAKCVAEGERDILISFSVKDSGIGMRAEELNRLFMPFEQAEHGTTRRFGGTGLGLSISESLVELMGGEIEVESEPNVGSTFRFTVKLETAPSHLRHPETLNMTGHQVLIVDDNNTNLGILGSFLNS